MNTAFANLVPQPKPSEAARAQLEPWFEIPHPGTLAPIRCATLKEAMEKWFEGFNIPVLVVDGVREEFSNSCERARRYMGTPTT